MKKLCAFLCLLLLLPLIASCGKKENRDDVTSEVLYYPYASPEMQALLAELTDPASDALIRHTEDNSTAARIVLPAYESLRTTVEEAKYPQLTEETVRALADCLLAEFNGGGYYLLPDDMLGEREVRFYNSYVTDVPEDYLRAFTKLQDFYTKAWVLNRVFSSVLLALTPEDYRFTAEEIYGEEALSLLSSTGLPESLYLALETDVSPEYALLDIRSGQVPCVELYCMDWTEESSPIWLEKPPIEVTPRIRTFGQSCRRIIPDAWSEEGYALLRTYEKVWGRSSEAPTLLKTLFVPHPSEVGIETSKGVELVASENILAEREAALLHGKDLKDPWQKETLLVLSDRLWLLIEENSTKDVLLPGYTDPETGETVETASVTWAVSEKSSPDTAEDLDALFLRRAQAFQTALRYVCDLLKPERN